MLKMCFIVTISTGHGFNKFMQMCARIKKNRVRVMPSGGDSSKFKMTPF